MNCYYSGILGLALIGGSVSTLSVNEEQQNYLKNTFSDDLDKIYDNIVIERRHHYIVGLVVGILLSILIVKNVSDLNYFSQVMLFLAITIPTSVLYYSLMPKSDYMLNHLKTPEQNKAWLEVYNTMKNRYHIGFFVGLVGYGVLCYAFMKDKTFSL